MYYYITEAPTSREEVTRLEQARELLTNLGISGEFVTTSPSRSVEELAELGVAKRYSTIVAIGSEKLLNQVATLLAGTPYIFGALPLAKPECLQLVSGIRTLQEAAEALKHRRIKTTSIARIEPNKFFLTEIRMKTAEPIPIRLTVDGYFAELSITDLRLAGSGVVATDNQFATGGRVSQLWQWLRGTQSASGIYASRFHGLQIVVETDRTYPVYLGSEVLAKTPLAVEILPDTLKMIMKRDTLVATTSDQAGGSNT